MFNLHRKADPSNHLFFTEWFMLFRLISHRPSVYTQKRYIRKFHWQSRPTKELATAQPDSVSRRYILDPNRQGPYLYHDVLEYASGEIESYITQGACYAK